MTFQPGNINAQRIMITQQQPRGLPYPPDQNRILSMYLANHPESEHTQVNVKEAVAKFTEQRQYGARLRLQPTDSQPVIKKWRRLPGSGVPSAAIGIRRYAASCNSSSG
ncbi:hypothetical protein SODG_004885 [Sodalis praecaptivus]